MYKIVYRVLNVKIDGINSIVLFEKKVLLMMFYVYLIFDMNENENQRVFFLKII